ncbi:hypothetical protein EDD70_2080 [Hydrogenoanaerobacterium saccharovorans]|uniref:Uncharacterized protein n=1 Tax=Hydrogenoanaerobacterium saccharovorans TaxID=474960 RepID=A0A1H8CHM0_9FIRM|nr:hypothetical protein [Hydrogenoanaerobacterium saccharovorans]RPF43122.1 hypothetical protein EDD70_2080 [Hydrogenoanaerobacterium saccharovorans]SEM94603.1 hypothetical protein SAMN05216180_2138 [Hydrogenoanaerobacterium saccharovorans]
MPNYEKMYFVLFRKVSEQLQLVQQVTEEIYIGTEGEQEKEGGS